MYYTETKCYLDLLYFIFRLRSVIYFCFNSIRFLYYIVYQLFDFRIVISLFDSRLQTKKIFFFEWFQCDVDRQNHFIYTRQLRPTYYVHLIHFIEIESEKFFHAIHFKLQKRHKNRKIKVIKSIENQEKFQFFFCFRIENLRERI